MFRLLRANFYRLFHSKVFWIIFALMPFTNIYVAVLNSEWYTLREVEYGGKKWFIGWSMGDFETFARHTNFMPYAAIVLVTLFVGEEFSSGALRNKIIAGHSRTRLYFGWFVTLYAGLLMIHFFGELVGLGYCLIRYGTGYYTIYDGARALFDAEFMMFLKVNAAAVISAAGYVGIILICVTAAGRKAAGAAAAVLVSVISDVFVNEKQYKIALETGETDEETRQFLKALISFDPRGLTELAMSYEVTGICFLCGLASACVLIITGVILTNKRDMR